MILEKRKSISGNSMEDTGATIPVSMCFKRCFLLRAINWELITKLITRLQMQSHVKKKKLTTGQQISL